MRYFGDMKNKALAAHHEKNYFKNQNCDSIITQYSKIY